MKHQTYFTVRNDRLHMSGKASVLNFAKFYTMSEHNKQHSKLKVLQRVFSLFCIITATQCLHHMLGQTAGKWLWNQLWSNISAQLWLWPCQSWWAWQASRLILIQHHLLHIQTTLTLTNKHLRKRGASSAGTPKENSFSYNCCYGTCQSPSHYPVLIPRAREKGLSKPKAVPCGVCPSAEHLQHGKLTNNTRLQNAVFQSRRTPLSSV